MPQFDEGATEGQACLRIVGMLRESGATHPDRSLQATLTTILFRELRESDGGRIACDPGLQVNDA